MLTRPSSSQSSILTAARTQWLRSVRYQLYCSHVTAYHTGNFFLTVGNQWLAYTMKHTPYKSISNMIYVNI